MVARRYLLITAVIFCAILTGPAQGAMTVTEETFAYTGKSNGYLRYVPAGYDGTQRLPLMIFLHGAGYRGTDITLIYSDYVPQMIAAGHEFSAIVLCPQCPNYWDASWATAFIDYALDAYAGQINPYRVYLTGESSGGFGAWAGAAQRADKLAALASCASAGGYTGGAENMVNLPIWAFHSLGDPYQPVQQTRDWVNACIAAGNSNVQYTEFTETEAEAGMSLHEYGWAAAYSNPAVWAWMFSQSQVQMGDYNLDGYVDQVDYVIWADNFGWTGLPGGNPADGNLDGVVNTVEYTIWADHFGEGSPPINHAPHVNAGSQQSITWPDNVVNLDGQVLDDGRPIGGTVTTTWSKQQGPGTVIFGDATAVDTTATFSAPGIYLLRLTADDGELSEYAEVTINVLDADTLVIITPQAYGTASGSSYCPATGAFDAQPTWDPVNEKPVGSDPAPFSSTTTEYASRFWYIDFGLNYANIRIHQFWTRYAPWSGGDRPGFAALWWDDDNDTVNDNGVAETTLNFHNCTTAHVVDQLWMLSADASAAPITPARRYLVIATPATAITRGNEFAIVGTVTVVPLAAQASQTPQEQDSGSTGRASWAQRAARRVGQLQAKRASAAHRLGVRRTNSDNQSEPLVERGANAAGSAARTRSVLARPESPRRELPEARRD